MLREYDAIVAGCGLSGSVVARRLAEEGNRVVVLEKRNHIGGNMYDFVNEDGILVHKYGPHTFHTEKKKLYEYVNKYSEWNEYRLTCGAIINGKFTPTPFNYTTVDDFFTKEKASLIKAAMREHYPNSEYASVLELLNHENSEIREYAQFLFDNDYSLYTAKQWGVSPSEISPDVLRRVPVRFNYEIGYFTDKYQCMPAKSFTEFFVNLLDHKNITVRLNCDVLDYITFDEEQILLKADNQTYSGKLVYTGPIDELFSCCFGKLPYRSLRFEWRTENVNSFQNAPVVAYPQAEGFTRITEYTKLPYQNKGEKTTYAIEYSIPYQKGITAEPYYPIITTESELLYNRYKDMASKYKQLYLCGRLADYKYYNMDQALERALEICLH